MNLKNSPFLGEFFSFRANPISLILFWLEKAYQDAVTPSPPILEDPLLANNLNDVLQDPSLLF